MVLVRSSLARMERALLQQAGMALPKFGTQKPAMSFLAFPVILPLYLMSRIARMADL